MAALMGRKSRGSRASSRDSCSTVTSFPSVPMLVTFSSSEPVLVARTVLGSNEGKRGGVSSMAASLPARSGTVLVAVLVTPATEASTRTWRSSPMLVSTTFTGGGSASTLPVRWYTPSARWLVNSGSTTSRYVFAATSESSRALVADGSMSSLSERATRAWYLLGARRWRPSPSGLSSSSLRASSPARRTGHTPSNRADDTSALRR
jgi:hypothetical protein